MLALMVFTTSVLLIPGQKYDTLTTSDSGWVYDTAFEINRENALAENNPLSHAPYGLPISLDEEAQPLIAVMIYRGVSAINPSVTLMDVVMYWAPLIFALSLIPIFLIGRELGGDVGGVAAVFFAATMVATIYWNKVGAFDREPIELILGAWAMYLTIRLFKASRNSIPKFALLAGMVYGLFGLAWGGWHYVIAVLVLGVLFVFLAGFLGKFSRKPSDLLGALFSAIRDHVDVLAGAVGMVVVITLVLWFFGEQGPGIWVDIFGAYTGYLGIGGGAGVSFTAYATEMQSPTSWGATLGSFYGSDFPAIILTAFILTLVILAFLKFCWSRKRWEILAFAWLVVLAAMVLPGKGQARFERMWWPFVPALAGVGAATLVSLVRRLSLEHYGEHLKHLQTPIALLLVAGIVAAPFIANTYNSANQTTPPTEIVSGLDKGFMEAFAWLQENTPENSVVSIQWSFGHLLTGVARRATVTDGAEVKAEEGTWENNPSFVPRPPDYIYYVEGSSAYIYGVDVSRRSSQINGRRIDVQWLPMVGENEFRSIIQTYRDNYGVKIDYVVFSIDEYYNAYNYFSSTQPVSILLSAERIKTPSSLQPSSENTNYVFNFGENRSAVVLDTTNQYVYLRTDNGYLGMDGYAVLEVDNSGNISKYDGFYRPFYTPDIQETLLVILNSGGSSVRTAWLIKGVSAEMDALVIPIGVNIFGGQTQDINYLQVVFTSSNNTVKIMKIDHVPHLISPENGGFTNDNTPDFSWDTIGASRYELEVDNNSSFSSPLIHEYNITSTTYTATVTLQDGEYYWRVAAYDSKNNLLGWSDPSTFTVDTQAPSPPLLSKPQNGTVLSTLDATFQWTQLGQGVKYDIQIDNENSFPLPLVHADTNFTENSYAYTFGRNGTYYWHVRAKDAAGNASEWSDTFALTIRASPQAPALSSPENGVLTNDNTPTLMWTGGNGDNYRLLLGINPDLSSPTLDVLLAPSVTSYTIPEENALLDGEYYWKVAAVVVSDENSSYIWTLTIDTVPPQAPVLYAPENGTEMGDNTPTFEWSLSPGADNYHLIVDNDIAFGSPNIDIWLVENTYTPTTGLPAENYYWKVTDNDVAGNENESSIWTFRIVSPGG
jgi:hypothetical protein